jgi:hypothetical protein
MMRRVSPWLSPWELYGRSGGQGIDIQKKASERLKSNRPTWESSCRCSLWLSSMTRCISRCCTSGCCTSDRWLDGDTTTPLDRSPGGGTGTNPLLLDVRSPRPEGPAAPEGDCKPSTTPLARGVPAVEPSLDVLSTLSLVRPNGKLRSIASLPLSDCVSLPSASVAGLSDAVVVSPSWSLK